MEGIILPTATKEQKTKTASSSSSSRIPVRRGKALDTWLQPDKSRAWFADENGNWNMNEAGFKAGLLSNVEFVHAAVPMACIDGYDSTGEAVGDTLQRATNNPQMPQSVKRQSEITYDRENREFHIKGKPSQVVDSADYLLLQTDGKAIAGWKK